MKKKKVFLLTEDWKVYHALQSFPVMLPSAPEDIHLVVFQLLQREKESGIPPVRMILWSILTWHTGSLACRMRYRLMSCPVS